MPAMPRPEGKGKKIAYDVLGVPQNMVQKKRSPKEKKIEQRLVFDETIRSR